MNGVVKRKPRRCRLDFCPPGLFIFNGTLCFKSEYVTVLENPRRYQCDAYVVESGEYFWGGASGAEARGKLMVEPIPRKALGDVVLPALLDRLSPPLRNGSGL